MGKTKKKTTAKKEAQVKLPDDIQAKMKAAAKVADVETKVKEVKEGPPPKRIKMKISLANMRGSFEIGHVYDVPRDVPEDTAKSWVECGAADKVE